MSRSLFQIALAFAVQDTGKIGGVRSAMAPLGDKFTITDLSDADALADVLITEAAKDPELGTISPFSQLVDLMRKAGTRPVFELLQSKALPALEYLFDRYVDSGNEHQRDLSRLLTHFVGFHRREGLDRVVRAIRLDFPCGYSWARVFAPLGARHPLLADYLTIGLELFPKGFVRVAYLDHATSLAFKGVSMVHPFDCDVGREQIRSDRGLSIPIRPIFPTPRVRRHPCHFYRRPAGPNFCRWRWNTLTRPPKWRELGPRPGLAVKAGLNSSSGLAEIQPPSGRHPVI